MNQNEELKAQYTEVLNYLKQMLPGQREGLQRLRSLRASLQKWGHSNPSLDDSIANLESGEAYIVHLISEYEQVLSDLSPEQLPRV